MWKKIIRCPNIIFFFRFFLAGMHFNENANRAEEKDEAGNVKIAVHFPKAKKGDYSIRILREKPTYGKLLCLHYLYF